MIPTTYPETLPTAPGRNRWPLVALSPVDTVPTDCRIRIAALQLCREDFGPEDIEGWTRAAQRLAEYIDTGITPNAAADTATDTDDGPMDVVALRRAVNALQTAGDTDRVFVSIDGDTRPLTRVIWSTDLDPRHRRLLLAGAPR